MRLLSHFADPLYAARLQQALATAGVNSHMTTQITNAYLGRMEYGVWVDEAADPAAIEQARASIGPSDGDAPPAKAPTRVSRSEGTVTCEHCGYDLRGQVQDGHCPECAHPYRVILARRCVACDAEVPGDFDICWNCGHGMPESRDAAES